MGKESYFTNKKSRSILGQGGPLEVDFMTQNGQKSSFDPKNIEKTMMQNKAFSSHLEAV